MKDIYSVLVRFMRKSALSNLAGLRARVPISYGHKKQPVLLAHYFAGARVEGLTEKQLAKKFDDLRLSQSPYRKGIRSNYRRWKGLSHSSRPNMVVKIH